MPQTEGVPPEPTVKMDMPAIIDLLKPNGELDQLAKKSSEAMSATGKLFQKIEKTHNGNRAAVSLIRRMQKMSDDKRADFIRTLEPLLVHYGYTLDHIDPDDLVTQAQTGEDGGDDKGEGEGEGEGDNEPNPWERNANSNALEKSRAHLTGGGTADEEPKAASTKKPAKPRLGIVSGGSDTTQ